MRVLTIERYWFFYGSSNHFAIRLVVSECVTKTFDFIYLSWYCLLNLERFISNYCLVPESENLKLSPQNLVFQNVETFVPS